VRVQYNEYERREQREMERKRREIERRGEERGENQTSLLLITY
jgi:hypothetical protein